MDDDAATTASEQHAASDALRGMFTRDFVFLAVSALQVVLASFVTPVLTRRVGAQQFGQVVLAVTAMQILGVILSFGLPFATQRVYARTDGVRLARGLLAISAVLALVACCLVVLAAPVWGPAIGLSSTLNAGLSAAWAASFALTWTCLAMLRSQEDLGVAIVVGAAQSLGAQAVGIGLLYLWTPTLTAYLCGVLAGQGAAVLVGLSALRPDWSAIRVIRSHGRALLFGFPMVPQQLAIFTLFAGDRIVVSRYLGSTATGRYSVAYNVGSLGVLVLVFINQAWTPRIYAVSGRALRARVLAGSRDAMHLLLVPVVIGLAAGAPLVLRLWAPPSFHPARLTPVVAIVATATFVYGQFLANQRALMSEGSTGRSAISTLLSAALNIGLNVLLVPPFGITGSAIATVISYALLAALSRPRGDCALRVPGVPRMLGLLIGCAVGLSLTLGVLPTGGGWLALRLAACAASCVAFAIVAYALVSGAERPGGLVARISGTVLPENG